ncbi:hypothetical protein P691DRAFT_789458 [Macrolepiota fuliginosa MF-IS2]|uniref:Nephrocystin 3-like N-terminal domain-containing protein n=1 Tax=Macrolepiota fuliginosa MF-IS2 TaxID=1400762 RepID=A0A9P5X309_9AGAR|nr:hypothetical protein P691DRAFT_789458 [Macrolepiota fuliginosa MF-IS2]
MAHSEPPKNTNLTPSLNITLPSDDELRAHSSTADAQSCKRPASMYSSDAPAFQNNNITPSSSVMLTPNETIPPTPSITVIPPNNPTHPAPIAAASSAATAVGLGAPARSNSPVIASPHPQVAPQMMNPFQASNAFAGANGWIVENFHIYAQEIISPSSSEMEKLLKEIIRGAQYDSSARDPPPECHPGTRVKMLERMCTWFFYMDPQKAFLWIYGPMGVGKSAVVQTFAEALAAANRLGATLFFSRPNNRNDPKRVFITIAYQLAVRIPSYRTFVIEQISLDPELLEKGMREQFKIFIVAPFVHRRIGQGREALGILLDGLDECNGQGPQCDIIRLISDFVRDYPDVPLVWVISSRPEPHICSTFEEDTVTINHWHEYIPVDSTEACQDVELFLTKRFEKIRSRFRYVSPHWPSETQRLKITYASSGLFVFAEVATHFIGDEDHADPESRLDIVLSVIDHSKVMESGDQPFATLDALYTHILLSTPQRSWPTAKLVLGHVLCRKHLPSYVDMKDPKAFSKVYNLELSTIYASLHKLHSVLVIPPLEEAEEAFVTFIHASFADYLGDSIRSESFFIDSLKVADDLLERCFGIMQILVQEMSLGVRDYQQHSSMGALRKVKSPQESRFLAELQNAVGALLFWDLTNDWAAGASSSQGVQSRCLDILGFGSLIQLWIKLS